MTFTNYRDDTGTRLRYAEGTAGPAGGSLELELVEASLLIGRMRDHLRDAQEQLRARESSAEANELAWRRHEQKWKQQLRALEEALALVQVARAEESKEEKNARHI